MFVVCFPLLFPIVLLFMVLVSIFFLIMVVFVSLEVNLLFLTVILYPFYKLWCYNACSLYLHKFLQVYHYQYNLWYVLCLWNVCETYASFLGCDFRNVYSFHRCRGYFRLLLVFELLVVFVFEKKNPNNPVWSYFVILACLPIALCIAKAL